MTFVNPPPTIRIPKQFLEDPETRSFFEQLRTIQFQLWQRTGGGTDSVEASLDHVNLANIGVNTHPQLDSHLALVNEHLDWEDSSVGTIDASNYVDNDTTDHIAFSNIGTNTHPQIDTHIALHSIEATTTELVDITDSINTDVSKELGLMVLNTTTGLTVFASGNTDGAVWQFYDESLAHTPV